MVNSSENEDVGHILKCCPVGIWELWVLGVSFITEWMKICADLVGVLLVLSLCTGCARLKLCLKCLLLVGQFAQRSE